MWIASGCDELWAREASLVGSVGVLFSQLRVHDLFEDYGVSYERIVSGDYKDALSSFKALDEDERAYLQALADAWYDHFVQRVAEGTEMDAQAVRDTEARIYLGEQAAEMGMVDALGDRAAVEDHLSDLLETEVTVQEFTPSRGLRARLGAGALRVAHAVGAGMARAGTDAGLRMRGR
jgi:protease-4